MINEIGDIYSSPSQICILPVIVEKGPKCVDESMEVVAKRGKALNVTTTNTPKGEKLQVKEKWVDASKATESCG